MDEIYFLYTLVGLIGVWVGMKKIFGLGRLYLSVRGAHYPRSHYADGLKGAGFLLVMSVGVLLAYGAKMLTT